MNRVMIYCATLLFIFSGVRLSAQVNGSSLTGLVTDSTGAVIQDAHVTAVNTATGVETAASTGVRLLHVPSTVRWDLRDSGGEDRLP
jgi:hypothetical protein